jgi:hypothetical protein
MVTAEAGYFMGANSVKPVSSFIYGVVCTLASFLFLWIFLWFALVLTHL